MNLQSSGHLPAIEGGTPVRSNLLPYGRQWLDASDMKAVQEVMQGEFLTTGPCIEAFEQKVSEYVGARYAVAFANGTAALHAACHVAGIRAGDEVITTPLTFVATANAVLYTGGTPVFADIEPDTCQISPIAVESLINERTKAILPVDFAGHPYRHEEINRIAKKHGLVVIEDAAHALGASLRGKKVGSWSDMTMFSFHPVKTITCGEGGVITTDNRDYYNQLKQFRSHGITRNPEHCERYEGDWYYEMHDLGYNYRMTDLQAALGMSQMNRIDAFVERRRRIAALYQEGLGDLPALMTPDSLPDAESSWHLYVIQLQSEKEGFNRKKMFDALRAENIGVNVHYIPVYKHPYYSKLGYADGICPETERCYESMITLPLFPAMTDQDVRDVISAVRKVLAYYVKQGVERE